MKRHTFRVDRRRYPYEVGCASRFACCRLLDQPLSHSLPYKLEYTAYILAPPVKYEYLEAIKSTEEAETTCGRGYAYCKATAFVKPWRTVPAYLSTESTQISKCVRGRFFRVLPNDNTYVWCSLTKTRLKRLFVALAFNRSDAGTGIAS